MVGKGASRISTAAIWLLSLLGVSEFGRICLVKEVVSGLAAQGDAASRRVGMAELEAPLLGIGRGWKPRLHVRDRLTVSDADG